MGSGATREFPATMPIPANARVERRPVLPGTWIPGRAVSGDNASDAGDAEDRSEERPRRAPVRSGAAATSNTNSDDNGDDASAADTEEDNSLLRRSTPADAASTGSGAITQEQLVELASQKAKTTPRQVDIRASDRDNLVGLRQPMPLPDAWIKMNRLSPERVRKTEAKLRRVIKDVNQLANYLSPASLLERIASGDLLAPMKLLGDTVKQALHLVTDITQDVLLLHRCRFVNYTPAAISAVSFSPTTYKQVYLACGRANGDIEIWDPTNRWLLLKTIPGGANEALETLAWSHQVQPAEEDLIDETPEELAQQRQQLTNTPPRLFSSGLNALITEWDLDTLRPKTRIDSTGGAVWCIAVNPQQTRLAAGCEDGRVRIYDIADGAFEYMRSFEPMKARILSVAWSKDGRYLVTGSADSAVRKWDTTTGRVLMRMIVGKEGRTHTMVWSVLMLA
ncbi:WD40-repeat-containing domain protein [Syncephalis pseudoplumigaleata]|uniref:WD40-repeat-containing domain protein n=1 Tax=Syncephalis pseudoplumigaleata TaxID=1712513 RepID=A0A4P9YZ74_9FUNG|nr:WD40-repeat-containing domain protein [Syncephalis pseudoplumigaleata]|eukprot:RKP24330.1 WD40-repeat-containing domain protein [Syncephalis pseudoplumigaleata]